MNIANNDLLVKLAEQEKEIAFHKRVSAELSNKYLRELEELSKYSNLLNEKISIINNQHKKLASTLNSIPADIYICDMDSHEVLFMNAQMKKSFGRDCVGMICWEAFRGSDSPCPHCTNGELRQKKDEQNGVVSWEGQNPLNKKWYLNHDRVIPWEENRNTRIQVAIDITRRIETEQKLENSQKEHQKLSRMLRLMCDNVPDMIWAKDLEKRYIFANRAICENLLNAADTDEPIGKNDLFFAQRERERHPEDPEWHTFGEICRDTDQITMDAATAKQFDEYGNIQRKFLYLDVYKAPFYDENGNIIGTVGSARDVTKAKENEKKLRETEAEHRRKLEHRYQTIFQTSQEGICSLDEKYIITFINEKMADMLGYNVEELQGKEICTVLLPSDLEAHKQFLQSCSFGLNESYTSRLVHKNGQILWMRISTTIIQDGKGKPRGTFLMFTDITETVEASNQLLTNFERLQMAQQVGKIGSWEYLIETKEVWICDSARHVCGISNPEEQDRLSRQLAASIQLKDQITLSENKRTEKERFRIEFQVTPHGKSEAKYIQSVAEPIFGEQSTPVKIIGVIQDITAMKKAERELKTAHEQLLHSEKLSAIGKLSASIAHEFNNPLQGVMNIISGVKERAQMSSEDKELIDMALSECNRMKGLIQNLQDFNRPTHTKHDLVDMRILVDNLFLLFKKDFIQRGITLVKEYAPHLPEAHLIGDQIKQVILNLLQNAADACQDGDTITIELQSEKDAIILKIIDTGCGIKEQDQSQIFNPFFTTKPDLKGTGLGLSVSYGIIKNHGGKIDVLSALGEGTAFIVTLPINGEMHGEHQSPLC